MYVFSSLLSPFTFPNVPPHLSPLQHISQKHKYIQIVQTSFESKSFKPQSSLDGSMATSSYGKDYYSDRRRNTQVNKKACPHCHQHFYGGSTRAASTHMRFCVSNPDNLNLKEKAVTKSNIKRTLQDYDEEIGYGHQNRLGREIGRSLHRKRSIREMANEVANDKESKIDEHSPKYNEEMEDISDNEAEWNPDDNSEHTEDDNTDNDEEFMAYNDHEDQVVDDFMKLPSLYQETSTLYHSRKFMVPDEDLLSNPPKRIKYQKNLTDTQVALVDLANLLTNRSKVDKKLFDDIAAWAKFHSDNNVNVWKDHGGGANVWTRKKLVKALTERYKCEDLRPKMEQYTTLDGKREITVPIFDIPALIRDLLDDPDVFNEETLMKGLNKTTWRPLKNAEEIENDPHFLIDDKDSGYLYWMGVKQHCPNEEECDPTVVVPLPLVFAIDKSHYDLHSNLCSTPIGFTLGILNSRTQQKTEAWKMGAVVPNLSAKKGKNKKRKKGSSKQSLQDMHNVLKIAFSSLKLAYDKGGIIWKGKNRKTMILKPYIHMVIGDTAGNNELCGHYLGGKSKCLVKDCTCPFEKLDETPTCCHTMSWHDLNACHDDESKIFEKYEEMGLISLKTLSEIINDEALQKQVSYHDISNFTEGLPLSDPHLGIVGMTAQELLHVMEAGNYEHVPLAIRDVIGFRDANATDKETVDQIFGDVINFIKRNSERDVLRMSNRSGFFNLTKVNGTERHGNFFAFTLVLHTSYGERIVSPHFEERDISFVRMRTTCQLLLAWDRFLMDSNERWMYDDGLKATVALMKRMKKHFPKEVRKKSDEKGDGSHGWNIVKFHVMYRVMANCLKFGSAKVTNGSTAEQTHKYFLKRLGEETQRRLESFASQIATNYFEHELFKKAYKHVRDYCMPVKNIFNKYTSEEHNEDSQMYIEADEIDAFDEYNSTGIDYSFLRFNDAEFNGEYSMEIKVTNRQSITSSHRWKDADKRRIRHAFRISPVIKYVLGRSAIAYSQKLRLDVERSFKITGYTSLKVPIETGSERTTDTIFRCNPMIGESEWYDFCLLRLPKTKECDNGDTCIARIFAIVKYETLGCPTFKHVEVEDMTVDQILTSRDDTYYLLVQCEDGFTEYRDLTKTFVKRITLQTYDLMHIVPVGCIIGPVLSIPDILDEGVVSTDEFIVAMGHHKWGGYFKHYSKVLRERRENDAHSSNSDEENENDNNEETSSTLSEHHSDFFDSDDETTSVMAMENSSGAGSHVSNHSDELEEASLEEGSV